MREKPREAGRCEAVEETDEEDEDEDELLVWRERRGRLEPPAPAGMLGGREAMTDMAMVCVCVCVLVDEVKVRHGR